MTDLWRRWMQFDCLKRFIPARRSTSARLRQQIYQSLVKQKIDLDATQQQAIQSISQLFQSKHTIGVFLWGGVGTGKSLLMDHFYACFEKPKARFHIYELYQKLMQQMFHYKQHNNPTHKAIQSLSRPGGVICIDDFYLRDIADAKLWQSVFEYWLNTGQKLIITSNQKPDQIMLNAPSYRKQINQLIAAMNQHLELVEVDVGLDYRQLKINAYKQSHYALIEPYLEDHFMQALGITQSTQKYIDLCNRQVAIKARFDNAMIVFSFKQLFASERSYRDYLGLSRQIQAIALVDYPPGLFSNGTVLQRLIWFIDVIYDNQTRLFWFVEAMPWSEIESTDNPEVRRCISRLKQMFSKA